VVLECGRGFEEAMAAQRARSSSEQVGAMSHTLLLLLLLLLWATGMDAHGAPTAHAPTTHSTPYCHFFMVQLVSLKVKSIMIMLL